MTIENTACLLLSSSILKLLVDAVHIAMVLRLPCVKKHQASSVHILTGQYSIQLPDAMALSESQLFRKVKALSGRSTAIHIRSIRWQKAKELLLDPDLTVAEVAYKTAFSDPSYFARTFSKEFGRTPTEFRN